MSRRHHHHTIQPYDYDRFNDRDRTDQARGIEYQDDSLSSINSDEESYLHHSHKEKKNYFAKSETSNKPAKPTEEFHQKTTKNATNSGDSSTMERLGRLETMLEELLKRNNANNPPLEKGEKSTGGGQHGLDPRRHDFTTSMWINKIQETSFQNKWTEKETIQYMATQMSGIIKTWYKSLANYDLTWPEWKIQITKIFPDNTDFITTLKRLVTRLKQPDETITTYYFSKMYLIEACKITGEDAVSCLIDGLNNQTIQEQAKARNFLTPESLYSQFLMLLPEYSVDYSPTGPEAVLNNWYYQEEEDGAEVEVAPPTADFEYDKEQREDFDYRPHNNEDRAVKSPPKRTVPVHSRLDKRFIRPNPFRKHNKIPMAAKVCTICGNRGHLAKQCRNADKVFSCNLGERRSGFYVDCAIAGCKLTGLVDTGCTTVTIRAEEAGVLGVPIRPVSAKMTVYGGGQIQVLGETEVELQVDSVKAKVRAMVVPDHVQDVAVLIGEEFINRKNVTMIVKNATVKITETE